MATVIVQHPEFPDVLKEVDAVDVDSWLESGWKKPNQQEQSKLRVQHHMPEEPAPDQEN